jgi:hypothetical protein
LDRIAGKPVPDKAIHLTSQLIVRGSTFAARDHAHDESRRLSLSKNQAT